MRRVNDGIWPIVGALLLGCIPSPTEVVPHADGSTGPAEGTTTSSEPPLPTSAGSTTAQAEGTGSATGADTSDAGSTQGAQPGTSTGEVASAGGTSTSSEPGTSTGEAASTSTSGEPGTSTGTPPSCDELFDTAPGYIYCTETDMACHFNATTSGSDCNSMCASLGSTCVAAFDNPNVAGQECDVIRPNTDTCDTDRGTEICACAK